jgi:hypothetical protein
LSNLSNLAPHSNPNSIASGFLYHGASANLLSNDDADPSPNPSPSTCIVPFYVQAQFLAHSRNPRLNSNPSPIAFDSPDVAPFLGKCAPNPRFPNASDSLFGFSVKLLSHLGLTPRSSSHLGENSNPSPNADFLLGVDASFLSNFYANAHSNLYVNTNSNPNPNPRDYLAELSSIPNS